jgi:hypothetical protein
VVSDGGSNYRKLFKEIFIEQDEEADVSLDDILKTG